MQQPIMKRLNDTYELKPRPFYQKKKEEEHDEEEGEEDEGKYTCSHGIEMSRRDTTICDTCYWESRPPCEEHAFYESLKQKQQQQQQQ
jgi:hypothetical protein